MIKSLSVRLYGKSIGTLTQNRDGRLSYTYDNKALQPLSLSLPVQSEPFEHKRCEAYFGGLLPESDHARKVLAKRFGISPNNTFSLLQAIGYDCAGAVSLHNPDEPIIANDDFLLEGRLLKDNELEQYIKELPTKPLFIGVDELRLSLAGVQDKAAICLIDSKVHIPQNNCPTTHILKPAIEQFSSTVQNEYFCMRLAKRLSLEVANVEMRRAKETPFLLIERYDRQITEDRIRRIHQEDFCQALGVLTTNKYQNEGGPGLKDCFDLLRQTAAPVIDRNKLAKIVMFNFLVGNNDAHGKNFSLLHIGAEQVQLAPLYDVLSTRIYEDLSKKMAMKIGSKYEIDYVQPRHWQKLCEDTGYSFPLYKETLLNMCEEMQKEVNVEAEFLRQTDFYTETTDTIVAFITRQCEKTINSFAKQ